MGAVNLGKGRIEAMLKVLDVEGAVAREGTRWVRVPDSDWAYDGERYANVTALRRHEQEAMAAFGADGRCLMRALQEELDDPDAARLRRLRGLHGAALRRPAATRARARRRRCTCARARWCSTSRRWRPDAEGKMRKLADDVRAEEGRALARLGDGGWDPLVQPGRRAGRFDDELVAAAAEAVRTWRAPVRVGRRDAVATQRRARARLRARGSPHALGLPFDPVLERVGDNPPQREMANSAQQVANVRGEFAVVADAPPPEPCLLVDDVRFTRLDAGDGRRAAAPPRRRPCPPARAVDRVLTECSSTCTALAADVLHRIRRRAAAMQPRPWVTRSHTLATPLILRTAGRRSRAPRCVAAMNAADQSNVAAAQGRLTDATRCGSSQQTIANHAAAAPADHAGRRQPEG